MKIKINILAIALGASAVLSSCNLNETPYGFYAEDNFYKTAADAEAAVNYAYGCMTFLEYSRSVFFLGDMPSDALTAKSDASKDNQDLDKWKIADFSQNGTLENFFKYSYIGINRSNAVIKKIPECSFDQELKDQYLGEAYFLRAYNYFNLVRNFGLVPMQYSVVETLDQTSAPLADNLDRVYDLILGDCRRAADLMGSYGAPRMGRADRVAAQALAAKAYLYVASAKEHGVKLYRDMTRDTEQMYDSAAYFADRVVNGQNVYHFDSSLLDIYDVEKPDGPEHIFLMAMDRSGTSEGEYSKISKMFIPYIDGATIYLRQGDSESFIPSHDGWGEYQTTAVFYNSFDENDLRKKHLICDKVYNASGEVMAKYPDNFQYPFSRKYIDPQFSGDKTSTRPFLIRFSDVALILAEAVGPTAEGYRLVNYIRNRAGLPDLTPGLDVNDFREAVYRERSFELSFEGDRMYDIRRFNRVSEIEAAKGMSENDVTFYPIPQAEINLNGSLR
ncbi:MAG: RagB/SusD family nutrient uptake outer membrane protein [Muribaculaceae bacterium]|nr:RagB/SusD family nutrient uptake outer membrane protein [Muribaculaceae bacterium]